MSINSGITSEALLALCVVEVLESKQRIVTYCFVKVVYLIVRIFSIEFLKSPISLLLFGSEKQTLDVNLKILNLTIQFLKDSGRFLSPCYNYNKHFG